MDLTPRGYGWRAGYGSQVAVFRNDNRDALTCGVSVARMVTKEALR
jgi:hypothetical protein